MSFEFDHPRLDLLAENGLACERGCFACGPRGQRMNHADSGCCGSTICDPVRWSWQIDTWLTIEQKYNLAFDAWDQKRLLDAYLEAEEAFREELRAKAEPQVEIVPPPPNNPSRRRGVAVAVRQKQAQEMRPQ